VRTPSRGLVGEASIVAGLPVSLRVAI